MALNKKAIFEVLNAAPLCHGHLIAQRGMAIEYCAMGALAKSVGATDEQLRQWDGAGKMIWNNFGPQITAKFGIETLQQFQSLMSTNDAEQFNTRRNKAVAKAVEALSPEEINEIIREEDAETVEVERPVNDKVEYFGPDE